MYSIINQIFKQLSTPIYQPTESYKMPQKQEYCTVNRSWPTACSTLASSTQRTTIVINRFRMLHSVTSWPHRRWDDGHAWFTTAVVWCQVEQEAVLIFAHILYLKPAYLPRTGRWALHRCSFRVYPSFTLSYTSPVQHLGRIWMRKENQWCQLLTNVP